MIETNDSVMSTRDYVKKIRPNATSEEILRVQVAVNNKLRSRKKKYLFHTEVDEIIKNRISNAIPNPIPVPNDRRKFTRNKILVVVKNGKEMPVSEAVKHLGDAKKTVLSRLYNYRSKHQIRDRILSNGEVSIIYGFKPPTDVENQTSERKDFSAEHVPPVNAENLLRYEQIVKGLKKGLEVMQSKSERKDFSAEHVPPVNAENLLRYEELVGELKKGIAELFNLKNQILGNDSFIRMKCIYNAMNNGFKLLELKKIIQIGCYQKEIEVLFPDASYDTYIRWMKIAENETKVNQAFNDFPDVKWGVMSLLAYFDGKFDPAKKQKENSSQNISVPINQLYLNFMNTIVNKEVHHKHFPSFLGKITSVNESGITVEWKEKTAKSNFEWSESGFLIILQ